MIRIFVSIQNADGDVHMTTAEGDDVTSAPRSVLEQLIISVYDDLTELNQSVQS